MAGQPVLPYPQKRRADGLEWKRGLEKIAEATGMRVKIEFVAA